MYDAATSFANPPARKGHIGDQIMNRRQQARLDYTEYRTALQALQHHQAAYPQTSDADAAVIGDHARTIARAFEPAFGNLNADDVWLDIRTIERTA